MAIQETAALETGISNEGSSGRKWRGSVVATIQTPTCRIWDVVRDFCGVHKWASSIETCKLVEGEADTPGCVRYCKGKPRRGASAAALGSEVVGETTIFWANEKLLAVDGDNRSQTYAVVDGNLVLQGYVATIRVCESAGNDASFGEVKWAFELDPVAGKAEQEFVNLLNAVLAAKLESLKEFLIDFKEA